ncbi:nucleotide sugar dehydrogenase [Litoricolaceae bacterium]|nr:nucleotide sugar dehydrogenase [Litorivicinaceae bacterium]
MSTILTGGYKQKILVVGLGYVGLPLAVALSAKFRVDGLDLNKRRISEIKNLTDRNKSVSPDELEAFVEQAVVTNNFAELSGVDVYIVTVPTPVSKDNKPDMDLLLSACEMIGGVLEKGCTVIFESTVYPGVTRNVCVPVLEAFSGLKGGVDFYFGYSPERVNPGDPVHRLAEITKVYAGCCATSNALMEFIYDAVVDGNTYKAATIEVAEAAKVIENTQRDLNIALMNELSMIFDRLNIDTGEVLKAASTKWNFMPFYPGLVGGHCIGVDPYYLAHCAKSVGIRPEVILAGRNRNELMVQFIYDRFKQIYLDRLGSSLIGSNRILIWGISFKENCPDVRNSKVMDLVELFKSEFDVDVYDPIAHFEDSPDNFKLLRCLPALDAYCGIIFAVPHDAFKKDLETLNIVASDQQVLIDLRGMVPSHMVDFKL